MANSKKIIITLAAIILIAGSIYYFKKKKKVAVKEPIAESKSIAKPLDQWLGPVSMVSINDGKVSDRAMRMIKGTTASTSWINEGVYHPVTPASKIKTKFWARAANNTNGLLYFSLRQFLDNKGTGAKINNGRSPYYPGAVKAHSDWKLYEHVWEGKDWQDGVKFVTPEFLGNYNGTIGYWEIQGFEMEEVK